MSNFSKKDLEVLSAVLACESLACKKAKIYSKTLLNQTLAESMEKIATHHEQRFKEILKMIEE